MQNYLKLTTVKTVVM